MSEGPKAAGVILKAADTGRILLLQRGLDDTDPAAGMWEAPGGKVEPGEHPVGGALREFAEEVGHPVPTHAKLADHWDSNNGVYRTHVFITPSEADVPINVHPDGRAVTNPDDPDGDMVETVAWWDPDYLRSNPGVRQEMRGTPWHRIEAAGQAKAWTIGGVKEQTRGADGRFMSSGAAAAPPERLLPAPTPDAPDSRITGDEDEEDDHFQRTEPGNYREGMFIATMNRPGPNRLGRCYELSGNKVMDARMAKMLGREDEVDEMRPTVVHGSIKGQGVPRIDHSWVESPDGSRTWEPATNAWYPTPAFHAYMNSRIDNKYPTDEAAWEMLRTGHYGPWAGAPDAEPGDGSDDDDEYGYYEDEDEDDY